MTQTIDPDVLRADLAQQARALQTSRDQTVRIAVQMSLKMRQAYDAGVSYNELERLTGLAAETVRRWVNRA